MPRQGATAERLTKRRVQAAEPRDRRYRINDTDQAGLYLFVYPSGRKAFGVRYVTSDGRESEALLGDFPGLTPEVARERAGKMRSDVRLLKKDPAKDRRQAKAQGTQTRKRTMEALGADFLGAEKARGKKSEATMKKARHYLESAIYPRLGSRPVSEIDHVVIAEALEGIKEVAAKRSGKSGAGAANDARKWLLQLFKRARFLGWIGSDPMEHVDRMPEAPRQAVATDAQLQALWAAWEARRASDDERGRASAMALQFLALTLQRGEEVASLSWAEIDRKRKLWTLPADRKKERRAAVVPLSKQALAILEEAIELNPTGEGPFIGRDGEGALKRNTLTQSFRRDCDRLEVPDLTPHDLRRTGRTAITDPERLGFPPHVGELVLNHSTGSSLQRTYDVNAYLTEKRRALEAWATLVDQIVTGVGDAKRAGGNVVEMKSPA